MAARGVSHAGKTFACLFIYVSDWKSLTKIFNMPKERDVKLKDNMMTDPKAQKKGTQFCLWCTLLCAY